MARDGAKRKPVAPLDEDGTSGPARDKRTRVQGSALTAVEGQHTLRIVADLPGLRAAMEEQAVPAGCETMALAIRCMSTSEGAVWQVAERTCRHLGSQTGPSGVALEHLQFQHPTFLLRPYQTSKHESSFEMAVVVLLHVLLGPMQAGPAARLAAANAGTALARDIVHPVAWEVGKRLAKEALRDMLNGAGSTSQAAQQPAALDITCHEHHIPYILAGGEAADVIGWACQVLDPTWGCKTPVAEAMHDACLLRYGGSVYGATVRSEPLDLAGSHPGLYRQLQGAVGVVPDSVLSIGGIAGAAFAGVAMTNGWFRANDQGGIYEYGHCCQLGDTGWVILWPIALGVLGSTRVHVEIKPWKPTRTRLAHLQFQVDSRIPAGPGGKLFKGMERSLPLWRGAVHNGRHAGILCA